MINQKFDFEINIATTSSIIIHPRDKNLVLIAKSHKHEKPVIPGGKLEIGDLPFSDKNPVLKGVLREVKEEIGTELINPRYIGKITDPNRDGRIMSLKLLKNCITNPNISKFKDPNTILKAHHGNPDYIYTGTINIKEIKDTEELYDIQFVDLSKIKIGDLSCSHDIILISYYKMVQSNKSNLNERLLSNLKKAKEYYKSKLLP